MNRGAKWWMVLAVTSGVALALPGASASAKGVCQSAFPSAKSTTKRGVTHYNRQASVREVVCGNFGHGAGKGFNIDSSMKCALISTAVGATKFKKVSLKDVGLFIDGACGGAELVLHPGAVTAISTACGWLSEFIPGAGKLLGLGCAAAPEVGNWLGTKLEARHEFHIAVDVIRRGKCMQYKEHPGIHSPWSAVKCRVNDPGFSTLPRPKSKPGPTDQDPTPSDTAPTSFVVPAGHYSTTPASDGSVLLVQDRPDWRTYDLTTGDFLQQVDDTSPSCAAGVFHRGDGADVVVGVDEIRTPAAGIDPASTEYFVVGTDARTGRQLWRTSIGDFDPCDYDVDETLYPSLGVHAQQSPSGQSVLFPAKLTTGNYLLIDLRQGNIAKLTGNGSVMIGSTVVVSQGDDPAQLYDADTARPKGTSSSESLTTCARNNGGYGCAVFQTSQTDMYVLGLYDGIVGIWGLEGPTAWTSGHTYSESEVVNGSTVVISPEVAYPAEGMTAYSLTDGRALWSLETAIFCGATNGRVFVRANDQLAVLDETTGEQLSYDPTQSSCPLVINGAIVEQSGQTLTVVRQP